MLPEVTLPDPPVVEHLLLENPWPITAALAGVAVVLLFRAWHRLERRPALVGLVCILLAAAAWTTARLFATDREHIAAQTRQLIDATIPLDKARFRAMFHQDATLRGPDGDVWLRLDDVLRELDESVVRHGLHAHQIRDIQAHQRSDAQGQTLLRLRSTIGQPERIVPTQWLFTWQRTPDGRWRIIEVQWLRLYNQEPHPGVWRR